MSIEKSVVAKWKCDLGLPGNLLFAGTLVIALRAHYRRLKRNTRARIPQRRVVGRLGPTHGRLILAVTRCLNYSRAWGISWDLAGKELAKGGMTDVYKTLKGMGKGIVNKHSQFLKQKNVSNHS